MNPETDKSHSEKPALVHFEQKKLKGFTPPVRWLSGVWPEGGDVISRAAVLKRAWHGRTDGWADERRPDAGTTDSVCIWRWSPTIYENSLWSKFHPWHRSSPIFCVYTLCKSFLTTGCQKLCKLWPNNGRQLCDFSVLISMARIVFRVFGDDRANHASRSFYARAALF